MTIQRILLLILSVTISCFAADQQDTTNTFNQLVDLLPFDVVLQLSENTVPIKSSELRRKTQEWMNLEFQALVSDTVDPLVGTPIHAFDRILLDDAKPRRRTRSLRRRKLEDEGGEEDGEGGEADGGEEGDAEDQVADETEEGDGETNEPLPTSQPVGEEATTTTGPDVSGSATAEYKATYLGVSIWDTVSEDGLEVPTALEVASYQLEALLAAQQTLLKMLQEVDGSFGLGSNVVGVTASINTEYENKPTTEDDGGGLNTVIIVAIVIAALAFLLLAFAMFMAWRQSHQRSNAFKLDSPRNNKSTGATDASGLSPKSGQGQAGVAQQSPPPSEVGQSDMGGGLYPDSVISEDISTSLTAYYKSGMAGNGSGHQNGYDDTRLASGGLNDAASVSSMESYGYSLDGYASTIGGGTKDGFSSK